MKLEYRILSSLEKVFCSDRLTPEIPLTTDAEHTFDAARGETIAFQIAFKCQDCIQLNIRAESELASRLSFREVRQVPCVLPAMPGDDFVLRNTPGLYPDPLCPLTGPLKLARGLWHAVWVAVNIPADFQPGIYDLILLFDQYEHPGDVFKAAYELHGHARLKIHVHPAILPEQKLICTNWFYADSLAVYYHEEIWSERFWQILENYFRDYTAHGRNMLLTPLWNPPLDTAVGHDRPTCQLLEITFADGKYQFDFSRLKRWLDLARKCGVKYFEMSHFFTQWGAKATPKIMVAENGKLIRKFGWDVPSDSAAYREFLNALLPRLLDFLRKEGLTGKCCFHISDEPSEKVMENYKRVSEPVWKYLRDDEFPVIDALSSVRYFKEGLIKRPVPDIVVLDQFSGEKINHRWCYFAPSSNDCPRRSYGAPSCRCRILGILLYLYDMEGFLHWGHNFWFTRNSLEAVNPWQETTAGRAYTGGHIYNVYPGDDGKPVDALHYEVFAEALQDLRLLQLLEAKTGRNATVKLICEGLEYEPKMNRFPHEAIWLWELRRRIFAALDRV